MKKLVIFLFAFCLLFFAACKRAENSGAIDIQKGSATGDAEDPKGTSGEEDPSGNGEEAASRLFVLAYNTGCRVISERQADGYSVKEETDDGFSSVSFPDESGQVVFTLENAESICGYAVWCDFGAKLIGALSGGEIKYVFYFEGSLYSCVSLSLSDISEIRRDRIEDGLSHGEYVAAERLTVTASDRVWLFGRNFDGDDLVLCDGLDGVYSSERWGNAEINGFGALSFGGEKYPYYVREGAIAFSDGNEERLMYIDVSKKTFSFPTDGFEGEYAGEDGVLILDGYGTATLGQISAAYKIEGESVVAEIGKKKYLVKENGYTVSPARKYYGKTYEAEVDLKGDGESALLCLSFGEDGETVSVNFGGRTTETDFSENGEEVVVSFSAFDTEYVFSLVFDEESNSFCDAERELIFFRS